MSEFWKGRPVLVTGAGGFIASHLVEELVSLGARVRAFIRYNSRSDPGLIALLPRTVQDELEVVPGDLRDFPAVFEAIQDVSTVFHLGAIISIPYSYRNPMEVIETNVNGTLNVLQAARIAGIDRVVHTSSSEVYGTAVQVPIDEHHPLQGQSPYSASKIGADKIVESFFRSYDLPVVTVRPFNTYGPRQSTRAVIPVIITQALSQNVVRLGNLEARRDLTYISDTVSGFLKAGETPGVEGQEMNLGTGQEVCVRDLANEIIELIGRPVEIHVDPARLRPARSEVQRLLSDNRLAKSLLDWKPEVSLREGLQRTIDWIAAHMDRYRPEEYRV